MGVLDKFRLDDRVAIVTGGSSGLGVAFAKALAEAGADVALGARRVEKLEETKQLVEQAGRKAIAVATDVSKPEDCQALVDAAMEAFGRVDVLVNNAGVGTAYPATREDPDEFRKVIDINLNGCYWMAQACGRVMEPGSSIVNISSVLGLTTAGLPQAAYSASKAALIGLTRDLAQQWTARKGIRVNALAPGFFESEMTAQYPDGYLEGMQQYRMLVPRKGDPEELAAALIGLTRDLAQQWTARKGIRVNALAPGFFESEMTAQYPDGYLEGMQQHRLLVQRKGDPEELAAALVFLASDAGGYVTGVTLPVDGGMSST